MTEATFLAILQEEGLSKFESEGLWQADLRLQALGASIQPGNIASIGLVQRAGFRPEKAPPRYLRLAGAWRGHPTWSITAQRWRQLAIPQCPRHRRTVQRVRRAGVGVAIGVRSRGDE